MAPMSRGTQGRRGAGPAAATGVAAVNVVATASHRPRADPRSVGM